MWGPARGHVGPGVTYCRAAPPSPFCRYGPMMLGLLHCGRRWWQHERNRSQYQSGLGSSRDSAGSRPAPLPCRRLREPATRRRPSLESSKSLEGIDRTAACAVGADTGWWARLSPAAPLRGITGTADAAAPARQRAASAVPRGLSEGESAAGPGLAAEGFSRSTVAVNATVTVPVARPGGRRRVRVVRRAAPSSVPLGPCHGQSTLTGPACPPPPRPLAADPART